MNETVKPQTVAAPLAPDPVFVTGSTMRHVVVMTATGSIGLIAIFAVDLLSLFYISRLGDPALTAGVGYATVVLFLTVSINVGLMIAVTALTARPLGAGRRQEARLVAGSGAAWSAIGALLVTLVLLPLLDPFLTLLGASGHTAEVARRFLIITLPSNAIMAVGMALSGVLRALGDARRAMWTTLGGGIVTAILDPILIFGLGLGVDGAAITTVVSRLTFLAIGLAGVVGTHRLMARPDWQRMSTDAPAILALAAPAILTNVATPVANGFIASMMARYGNEAIAASAIIDRLVPVAFAGLFALSGSVGPILAQNWGAGRFDRMRRALRDALIFAVIYVCVMWVVLALGRNAIVSAFAAPALTAELVVFFCLISGIMWMFIGLVFVANSTFNNLGFPFYSTAFNWGRATLGTVPFAFAGAMLAGPRGILAGAAAGSVLFGIAAVIVAFRSIERLRLRAAE